MILRLKAAIHALGIALLSTVPTGLIFGFLTWSHNDLFYFMVVLHCLVFIGAFVMFLLPEEKQWKFIRGFAAFTGAASKHPQPEDYQEILSEIDKLERRSKDEGGRMKDESTRRREIDRPGDWGARRHGKDRHGDGETRRHGKDGLGDGETRRHGKDRHGDGETRRHGDD